MKKSTIIINLLLASCILSILILSLYAYISDLKSNNKHKFDIIPKIIEDFNTSELKLINDYENEYTTLYYNEKNKEIIGKIDDEEKLKYDVIGKYGKLYKSPIHIENNYIALESNSFGNYSIEKDEEGNDYLIDKNGITTKSYETITPIYYKINDILKVDYLFLRDKNTSFLLNIKDNKLNNLNERYELIKINNNKTDKYNNPKYLIAKKNNKYGLIEYNGNIVLDYIYDELDNYTSKDEYIIKKDKLYGMINSKGEYIINNSYDDIKQIENYIILLKNNKISILYNNKIIVDETIVYNYSKLPDNIHVINDSLYIITSIDAEEFSKSFLDNSGSYLINKEGKIKKIDGYLNGIYKIKENYQEELSFLYSINENNTKLLITVYDLDFYQYYAFSIPYDKAYKYSLSIDNIINTEFYKVKLTYEVSKELNNYYYIDLFNSKTVDESVLLKYFDNGYSFILNDNNILKIFKNEELISEYTDIDYYLGGYYFSKGNSIYEITFKKDSK